MKSFGLKSDKIAFLCLSPVTLISNNGRIESDTRYNSRFDFENISRC